MEGSQGPPTSDGKGEENAEVAVVDEGNFPTMAGMRAPAKPKAVAWGAARSPPGASAAGGSRSGAAPEKNSRSSKGPSPPTPAAAKVAAAKVGANAAPPRTVASSSVAAKASSPAFKPAVAPKVIVVEGQSKETELRRKDGDQEEQDGSEAEASRKEESTPVLPPAPAPKVDDALLFPTLGGGPAPSRQPAPAAAIGAWGGSKPAATAPSAASAVPKARVPPAARASAARVTAAPAAASKVTAAAGGSSSSTSRSAVASKATGRAAAVPAAGATPAAKAVRSKEAPLPATPVKEAAPVVVKEEPPPPPPPAPVLTEELFPGLGGGLRTQAQAQPKQAEPALGKWANKLSVKQVPEPAPKAALAQAAAPQEIASEAAAAVQETEQEAEKSTDLPTATEAEALQVEDAQDETKEDSKVEKDQADSCRVAAAEEVPAVEEVREKQESSPSVVQEQKAKPPASPALSFSKQLASPSLSASRDPVLGNGNNLPRRALIGKWAGAKPLAASLANGVPAAESTPATRSWANSQCPVAPSVEVTAATNAVTAEVLAEPAIAPETPVEAAVAPIVKEELPLLSAVPTEAPVVKEELPLPLPVPTEDKASAVAAAPAVVLDLNGPPPAAARDLPRRAPAGKWAAGRPTLAPQPAVAVQPPVWPARPAAAKAAAAVSDSKPQEEEEEKEEVEEEAASAVAVTETATPTQDGAVDAAPTPSAEEVAAVEVAVVEVAAVQEEEKPHEEVRECRPEEEVVAEKFPALSEQKEPKEPKEAKEEAAAEKAVEAQASEVATPTKSGAWSRPLASAWAKPLNLKAEVAKPAAKKVPAVARPKEAAPQADAPSTKPSKEAATEVATDRPAAPKAEAEDEYEFVDDQEDEETKAEEKRVVEEPAPVAPVVAEQPEEPEEPEEPATFQPPRRVPVGSKWGTPLRLNAEPAVKAQPATEQPATQAAAVTVEEKEPKTDAEKAAEDFLEADEEAEEAEKKEEKEEKAVEEVEEEDTVDEEEAEEAEEADTMDEEEDEEEEDQPRQRVVRVDSAPEDDEEADADTVDEDDQVLDADVRVAAQGLGVQPSIGSRAKPSVDCASEDIETADSSGTGLGKGDAERSDEERSDEAGSSFGSVPSAQERATARRAEDAEEAADSDPEAAGRSGSRSGNVPAAAVDAAAPISLRPTRGKPAGKTSLLSGTSGYLGPRPAKAAPGPNTDAMVLRVAEMLSWRDVSDEKPSVVHCVAMVHDVAAAAPPTPSRMQQQQQRGSGDAGKGIDRRDSRGSMPPRTPKGGSGTGMRRRGEQDDFEREPLQPLEVSSSSWAAQQKLLKLTSSDDLDETVIVTRRIRAVLNKLTLEKFGPLLQQLTECGISTQEHLEILMHEVMEKATTQHHFIAMYTDLCVHMQQWCTENQIGDKEKGSFKRILLNECQNSFERYLKPPDHPKELSDQDREIAEVKYKTLMIGNIRFVGSLLSKNMVASQVILAVTHELLNKPGIPEALECLCAFLTTIGGMFDKPDWKHRLALNTVFHEIKKLTKDTSHTARLRCLLSDVLDLRATGWQDQKLATKSQAGPMTLEEVHNKAWNEQQQHDNGARSGGSRGGGGGQRSGGGGQQSRGSGTGASSGGWHQVGKPATGNGGVPKSPAASGGGRSNMLATASLPKRPSGGGGGGSGGSSSTAAPVRDLKKLRDGIKATVKELSLSHEVSEAVQRIRELRIPEENQAAEFVALLAVISEEGNANSRPVCFRFAAKLFLDGVLSKSQLPAAIVKFFLKYEDLRCDTPTLPKILLTECLPALEELVPAGILAQDQLEAFAKRIQ